MLRFARSVAGQLEEAWEPLSEHLRRVGERAAGFAMPIPPAGQKPHCYRRVNIDSETHDPVVIYITRYYWHRAQLS